jgi:hypothetical protein
MSQGQPLKGDNGPVSTACAIAETSISLAMCQGLAATIAAPAAVAPAALEGPATGMAVMGAMKLAQRFL